jgi:EAL domain-containing protein (putative c-di-GMP-specific phosphodiesterase class I)
MNMINSAILAMDQKITQQENTYSAFTQGLKKKQVDEAKLSSLMKSALDNNEFILWFQPQYSTSSNKLVGAEALCRWINNEGQIISPAIFIPVTEKNGFIRYLDKEIWRKAFGTLRRWIDEGYDPVPISINISRVSLESDGIYYTIKYLKDEYNIPPELVHFEITESAYIGDEGNFLQRINLIRSLGFKIAMDDFGNGYSSLNSLKDIPIDIIKLDMGFLNDNNNIASEKQEATDLQNRGGTIISSVIRMAQKLKYITVAEGVENQAQAQFLKSIGCDIIQGFLYAKPMPEDAFISLLKEKDKQFNINAKRDEGQFNIASFVNPTTQESYVFDHFVGAALIVEYNVAKAHTTILRTNNQAKDLFGVKDRSFDVINNLFSRFVQSVNGKAMREAFEKASKTLDEVKCEVRIHNLNIHNVKHIRSHIWQINTNQTSFVFYILFEDISEFRNLEESLDK